MHHHTRRHQHGVAHEIQSCRRGGSRPIPQLEIHRVLRLAWASDRGNAFRDPSRRRAGILARICNQRGRIHAGLGAGGREEQQK
jgi:hypothetical protein